MDGNAFKEVKTLDKQKTNAFAKKWLDKFQSPNTTEIELLDHYMADDCFALGFQMDCGNAFGDVYGKAVYDANELKSVIDSVSDPLLLGSAIFSRWRYFNHWAGPGESILSKENREWFVLALSRLADICCKQAYLFHGIPVRIKLISNNISFGPMPEPTDIVEQRITVNDAGRVWLYNYQFGESPGKLEKESQQLFSINRESAKKLINTVAEYFRNDYEEVFATDIGQWTLQIINSDKDLFEFRGSLCASLKVDGVDLSALFRKTIGTNNLFAFDGNSEAD